MHRVLSLILTALPLPLLADPPQVVTDIAPIQSLAQQVMGDLATVDTLVGGGASPHDFQFTFTQAESVQNAGLVIWVGAGLTPWLDEALDTLAVETPRLTLLDTDGWQKLDARDWDDGHDHGDDDHGGDDHGDDAHEDDDHDDHADEDHDAHDGHEDHEEAHDADHAGHDTHDADHAGHDHGAIDPHAWLDPSVAIAWTNAISGALSDVDPDNAATYAANAEASIERLKSLDTRIAARMDALPPAIFLVPHDAYQYFGARYGVPAAGAIAPANAETPSPARVAELQEQVRDQNAVCVLSDPQARAEWSDLVRDGTSARTAVADPMGGAFPTGPDLYANMMLAVAQAYEECLGG